MKFTELNLNEQIIEAINYMGFDTATPVQEISIPYILDNRDLIACAQTGTGKTAAFVIPILHKLVTTHTHNTNTLIIVPTRELALQIDQQIEGLSYFLKVSSIAIYGGGDGMSWDTQKEALKNGTNIIVATPGKLLSHLQQGYVEFNKIEHLVLDEADRMLDMGFFEDIRQIISYLPEVRQTLMFSATMPKSIEQLANTILKNPAKVSLSISKPAAGVKQTAILCFDSQKNDILKHIIKSRPEYDSFLIFTGTKLKVSDIVSSLKRNGFQAQGISSNLEQTDREELLRKFKAHRIPILVATDVMSRGIDVKEINMVINYDVPGDAEDYVHRVGRTARVDSIGEAISLVNNSDMSKLSSIEKLIEAEVPKEQPPEHIGKGPDWQANARQKRKFGRNKHYGKRKEQNSVKRERPKSDRSPKKRD
jgi:superfamily II DNA/RNA helicase